MFDPALALCKAHCPRLLSEVLSRAEGQGYRADPTAQPFVPGMQLQQPLSNTTTTTGVVPGESGEELVRTAKLLEEQGKYN